MNFNKSKKLTENVDSVETTLHKFKSFSKISKKMLLYHTQMCIRYWLPQSLWVKVLSWINLRWLTISVGLVLIYAWSEPGQTMNFKYISCVPLYTQFEIVCHFSNSHRIQRMMKSNCSHFIQCSTRINYHIKSIEWIVCSGFVYYFW